MHLEHSRLLSAPDVLSPANLTSLAGLLQLFSTLTAACQSTLLYHVCVGNQIVVRSADTSAIAGALALVTQLLPSEFFRVIPMSSRYREPYECNLLGVAHTVGIPDENSNAERVHSLWLDCEWAHFSDGGVGLDMQLVGGANAPPLLPTLARQLLSVLTAAAPITVTQMRLRMIHDEWISRARMFLALFSVVPDEHDARVRSFMDALRLSDADIDVLRFLRVPLKSIPLSAGFHSRCG